MESTNDTIVVETITKVSVQSVWRALTDVEHLRQWMFEEINAFEPKIGFETSFSVSSGTNFFLHQWRVIDVMPPKKLAIHWTYGGYAGDSTVIFEVFDENGSTRIRLIHQGVDSFPQDVEEFKLQSIIEGWTMLIRKNLINHLTP